MNNVKEDASVVVIVGVGVQVDEFARQLAFQGPEEVAELLNALGTHLLETHEEKFGDFCKEVGENLDLEGSESVMIFHNGIIGP